MSSQDRPCKQAKTITTATELADELVAIDLLALEVAAAWKFPKSGVELIEEQRR